MTEPAVPDIFDPYHKWLGISPKDQPPNHYRLLAIDNFERDADVIASAADKQMGHIRSFQSGKFSQHSQKMLNEISAARICLLNAEKKAEYDRALRKKLNASASASGVRLVKALPEVVVAELVAPESDLFSAIHTPATNQPHAQSASRIGSQSSKSGRAAEHPPLKRSKSVVAPLLALPEADVLAKHVEKLLKGSAG